MSPDRQSVSLDEARSYFAIRSIMESPILNDHKWAKVPSIHADAFFVDMEDSVRPEDKVAARDRVVEYLAKPEYFNGAVLVPRVNGLDTEWGAEDLEAIARSKATCIAYPKARSAAELLEVNRVLGQRSNVTDLIVLIETAAGLLAIEDLVSVANVRGLVFGPLDLALDAGMTLRDLDDGQDPDSILLYARSRVALTAAAAGIACFDSPVLYDLRDLNELRGRAKAAKNFGFSGMITFYPPHIEVLNSIFSVGADEIEHAQEVVHVYEAALRDGSAAARVGGRVFLVQDYKTAKMTLARAHVG
jgi:citrate lyase beta subunit